MRRPARTSGAAAILAACCAAGLLAPAASFAQEPAPPAGAPSRAAESREDAAGEHGNPFRIEATKELQLPGKRWTVSVALPGFDLVGKSTRPDESGAMFSARDVGTNVAVTLRLERESEPLASIKCRGKYFPRELSHTLRRKLTRRWESGELAMGEYVGEMKPGSTVPHMHVHGYMGKEDVCISLYVSKVPYDKEDRPLIDAVFDSLAIIDGPP